MAVTEFIEKIKSLGWDGVVIEVAFTGEMTQSPFSGLSFVYAEACGDDRGTYSTIHTNNPLILCYSGLEFEINYRSLRPYLQPAFNQKFKKNELSDNFIFNNLIDDKTEFVTVKEYGILPEKTYYALPHQESYHLPPRYPDGEPERGTNTVLIVSDRPINNNKPQGELTPVFSDWSY